MNPILAPLLFLSFCFISCISQTDSSPALESPNIIVLLADDLGYGDLGSYGGTAHTPNLDQLAQEGIRFTDFYSAAPNCSPSRVGLLTGRDPSMLGVYNYLPEGHPMHLKGEEITLAEMLKEVGYKTAHFGKWHVACLPQNPELNQPQPDDQGFDYSLGTENNAKPSHLNPVNFIRNGEAVGEINGYSCDIVVDEAISWLDKSISSPDPFFLYLAFHEPHKKVASPPELTAKYSEEYDTQNAEYFANVENMDQAIGRLLQSLKEKKLDENTLLVFASDNGSYRNGSNGALLGGKSFVYEGGIRVPGILHWKGKVDGGQTITEATSLLDLMPTFCELTGSKHPRPESLSGTSLVPLFSHQKLARKKPLSWFFYRTTPEMAMRIGEYSIVGRSRDTTRLTHPMSKPDMEHIRNVQLEDFELYDLREDIGQAKKLNWADEDLGKYTLPLLERLQAIQQRGTYWNNLPEAKGRRRLKSEWRQLKPTGFSN